MQGSAGSAVGEKRELFIAAAAPASRRLASSLAFGTGAGTWHTPPWYFPRGSQCERGGGRHDETVESNDTSNKKRRHV